ncbi:hypothetical protein [Streptomyces sp. NPDC047108]|uniref:hypothetical protein n=1 Tax=Streptomyces sp. NPDC047108 TaxID=3155025 RepID=UPI0033E77861
MSDGGGATGAGAGSGRSADSGDGTGDRAGGSGGAGRSGPFARLTRKRLILAGAVLVLAATGAARTLGVADSGDAPPCWQPPASARALASDPREATKALDPGDDLARLGAARKLLAHERVCGDGGRLLGRIVDGATRSAGPDVPHTMAQARAAYAVAAALHDRPIPAGTAPGVARMLAGYVVDAGRPDALYDDEVSGPAVAPDEVLPDRSGWTWAGRFLARGEAHAAFEYADSTVDADTDIEKLVAELAADPEAFAVLHDAELARFAYYLERLTREGGDPDFRAGSRDTSSSATTWVDNDLQDMADRIGLLMRYRTTYAEDGTIPDLAAFDRSVREHTRGTFRPAPRQVTGRPPMGAIADRPVAGPVRGDLMDGRRRLFTVLDRWADERGVPARRAAAMRQILDDAYVRALWLIR